MIDIEDFFKLQEEKVREKEAHQEEIRRQKQRKEEEGWMTQQKMLELELEEKRINRQMEEQKKAKLPKLLISKFDGTVTDWVRFWELF